MAQVRRTQAERTAATRTALLNATVDTLVEQGYRHTTTQTVARRAGTSYGALLHHFPAKADLLTAAVGHLFQQRIDEFRKAMADLAPGTETREAAIDVLWSMFQGPTFTAWLELRVASRTDPELAAAVNPVDQAFIDTCVDIYRELFPDEAAADPELPRVAVGVLFTFLDGLALNQLTCAQPADTDELLTIFKLLIANTLQPPQPTPEAS